MEKVLVKNLRDAYLKSLVARIRQLERLRKKLADNGRLKLSKLLPAVRKEHGLSVADLQALKNGIEFSRKGREPPTVRTMAAHEVIDRFTLQQRRRLLYQVRQIGLILKVYKLDSAMAVEARDLRIKGVNELRNRKGRRRYRGE